MGTSGHHNGHFQIVDKNRLQCNAFSKSMQKNLAKIANSWLTGPPKFSTIPGLNFGAIAAGNPDMYFLYLNFFLLHIGKFGHQNQLETA